MYYNPPADSFPQINILYVGDPSSDILKMVALKECLVIFKEDGVYRLTGSHPNFSVEEMDKSAVLLGNALVGEGTKNA